MGETPDPEILKTWFETGKSALEFLKVGVSLLPKGQKREEIQTQLNKAERALGEANAKMAKELGYEICHCTHPPQIMLWREREKATVCPNPDCGRRIVNTFNRALPGT